MVGLSRQWWGAAAEWRRRRENELGEAPAGWVADARMTAALSSVRLVRSVERGSESDR